MSVTLMKLTTPLRTTRRLYLYIELSSCFLNYIEVLGTSIAYLLWENFIKSEHKFEDAILHLQFQIFYLVLLVSIFY